ncbi:MAG: lipid A biosynthesis acyltransferase [Flavobacteriales bacterium]|nr:MAG: lipid A biosynthesis acyltransferase [Flavobacteriales bacterium]
MPSWSGQSRGNVLGYKIFVFFLRHIGLSAAYFLLRFVALYFCFFSGKAGHHIHSYFRQMRGYGYWKSLIKVYQNYYIFGQTLIDKVAILSGFKTNFTYDFDGEENLVEILKQGKGGILISAHIGNFEISGNFLQRLNSRLHLVTTDAEHAHIRNYLNSVMIHNKTDFIIVKEDLSHIFHINKALKNNEMIVFTGDRFMGTTKKIKGKLLGKDAWFPAGPFKLACRHKIPTIFVFVMKETNNHYHFYGRMASTKDGPEKLLEQYTTIIESMLEKYPEQWFNYYDFWAEK